MNKPEIRSSKPTEFKSSCCDAPVIQYEATGKGAERHWLGHQCAKCGNQAPLSVQDLIKAMGIKS